MELIGLYYGVVNAVQEIQVLYGVGITIPALFLYGLIGVGIWAILFTLQGFGLRAMAKHRGVKNTWRAFVPFVNILLMGELAGTCTFFGKPIKRAGLLAMIFQIIATVILSTQMAAQIYLYLTHAPTTQNGVEIWGALTGLALTAYKVYNGLSLFAGLAQIFCEIMFFILLIGLYKNYSAKNYMIFGVLGILLPISRMIIIFVLRKNKYVNYDAMLRARREAYIRQQQQYQQYQNPYNQGGYGGYNNGYGAPERPQQPAPEDPFEEFGFNGNAENQKPDEPFDEIFN